VGFSDKGAEKARNKQRDAIIEEASKAGARVVDISIAGDAPTGSSVAGSMAKVFFGGKVSIDDAQVFTFDSQGFPHVYIQPYDGMMAMPGFHHASVPGVLPAEAILTAKSFNRISWIDTQEDDIDGLNSNPVLGMATKTLEWKWKAGTAEIKLKWAVKLAPGNPGAIDITMRAGRYGGFTTYGVGVGVFLNLTRSVYSAFNPNGTQG
jgi:hypothetical protein